MVLPIILGAIAIGSAVAGGVKGFEAKENFDKAQRIGKDSEEKYKRKLDVLRKCEDKTNKKAQAYGDLQLQVKASTFARLAAVLEILRKKCNIKSFGIFDGVEINVSVIDSYKEDTVSAVNLIQASANSVSAGAAAGMGTTTLVGLFGTASTGAAISGLSGAAATNATLAALGGGSLAAGGGSMALGSLLLGGIAIGPALAVGGFLMAAEGEKALTKAEAYRCEVDKACATMSAKESLLQGIDKRTEELEGIVGKLNSHILTVIASLESLLKSDFDGRFDFNADNVEHISKVQTMAYLGAALREILSTPLLDNAGMPNDDVDRIIVKYKS